MTRKNNTTDKTHSKVSMETIDVGMLESPIIDIDEEVSQEFEDSQKIGNFKLHNQIENNLPELRSEFLTEEEILSGQDPDIDLMGASMSGESFVVGGNSTPDQSDVDIIGKAVGLEYKDGEELNMSEKLDSRDISRWELEPQSSEDYKERSRLGFNDRKKAKN